MWKRRMNLEARVNLLIKRRFGRFQEGTLSSEDFEKATGPERNLDRVNEEIAKIEHTWSRNFRNSRTVRKINPRSELNDSRISIYRIFVAALKG